MTNEQLKHMDHIRYGWATNPWVWVYCYDWYSDCDNCKHSIDRDMGDYEVCLECKRYHEDRWEPKE